MFSLIFALNSYAMKFILVAFISLLFLVVFTVTTQYVMSETSQLPTITVDIVGQGSVLGNLETTQWTNQTFMQFRGIPFAESPRGNLRFKAPVARLPWRQIFDATKYGRRCPVITTVSKLSANELAKDLEDCLNLCVYTKNLSAKQPVMLYVYGGGFYNGSAEDHPARHLLEQDIVLVVPQYRVGALGWLTTFDENMPGNVPIMDIRLALDWVQKHIHNFGGDAAQVTIFGQSAGSAVTGSLLLSPTTPQHLFKRAIMQSGSILANWAVNKKPREQVERICERLKCTSCSRGYLHKCLKESSVLKLLEVTTEESFSPVVGDLNDIIAQHPSELMKQYNKNIAVMTGFTKHDGSFVLATYYDGLKKAYGDLSALTVRQFASGLLDMSNDTTRLTDNLLMRLLFTPQLLSGNDHKSALPAYFDLTNTLFMKSPIIALATQLARKGLADTYLYTFDYEGANTRFGYEFGNEHYPFNGGVHHSNDNIYLFSSHQLNEVDTKMAQTMVQLWTSFAMTGVPTYTAGTTQILPMNSESGPYFHINKDITIADDVLQELTATLDDPYSGKLDRPDIEF